MIRLICPQCHKKFRVSDDSVGKKATCVGCGARISISNTQDPSPPDGGGVNEDFDRNGNDDAGGPPSGDLESDQAEHLNDEPWDETAENPLPRTRRKRVSKPARSNKGQYSKSRLLYVWIGGAVVLLVLITVGATRFLSGTFAKTPEHKAPNVPQQAEKNEPKAMPPQKTAVELSAEANAVLDSGDNEAALAAFSKAIDTDNQSAVAFNGRGVAHLRLANLKPALEDFTRAIKLKPDEAKFYANRAIVYQDQGDYGLALADLSKAIKLDSQSPPWYRQRALVFSLMDDADHAKADLARAETLESAAQKVNHNAEEKPIRAVPLDLANAETLQAPALGKNIRNMDPFASEMRTLASDEFVFKDAQRKTFRSRFDQTTLLVSPLVKLAVGRNTIVNPPKYDFDSKKVSLGLLLFYQHHERRDIAGQWFPEDTDRCAIVTEFELDEVTARKWRDAFNRGNLVLDIWYVPLRVQSAGWQDSPSFTDDTLSHDIVIEVQTLRCEMTE